MKLSIGTLIKKYESAAKTFEEKGGKEWAKAKSGEGGYHYEMAKKAYKTAATCREKADELKNK